RSSQEARRRRTRPPARRAFPSALSAASLPGRSAAGRRDRRLRRLRPLAPLRHRGHSRRAGIMSDTPVATMPEPEPPARPPMARFKLAAKVAVWILIVGAFATVVPVFALRWINPPTSAFMLERRMQGMFIPSARVHIDYVWVDLDNISRNVQLAV